MPQESSRHKRIQVLITQSKRETPIEIDINEVKQLPIYQKREPGAEGGVARNAIRDAELAMMDKLVDDLKANSEHIADPIVLCDVDGELILVDGHHRYDCYKAANRNSIPARILVTSDDEARTLSSVLNAHNKTVPQGQNELREIAWQELKRLHDGDGWSGGWSARKLASSYGIGAKTVDRMVEARKKHGDGAADMTWQQARSSHEARGFTATDRLLGWISSIDKFAPQSEHEVEVLAEVLRQRHGNYEASYSLAERLAPYLEDPKRFQKYLKDTQFDF